MPHIHTSIISRHLDTKGNNKILRTTPPHIISSEEILSRLTRRTLAQLRTNKSPYLKSYVHKVDAKITSITTMAHLDHSHTQHTSSLQLHPHNHPVVTPRFVDRPRRSPGTAGWWTTSGKIGPPPLIARVNGVGKQHQQVSNYNASKISDIQCR